MTYILYVKPTFNCYVSFNNKNIFLKKDRLKAIKITGNENIFTLSILPEEQNLIPFSISIRLREQVLNSLHHNCKLIPINSTTLLLTLSPFLEPIPQSLSVKSQKFYFANSFHTVFYTTHDYFAVKLENPSTFCQYTYPTKVSNTYIKTSNNHIVLYSNCQNSKDYIILVIEYTNNKYNLITLEQVDLLELEQNKILTYSFLKNFAKHGITKTYTLSPSFKLELSLVSHYENLKLATKRELIPYAFFDAVMVEDFSLARKYLAPALNEKLQDTHLLNFFGNFESYTQNLNFPTTQPYLKQKSTEPPFNQLNLTQTSTNQPHINHGNQPLTNQPPVNQITLIYGRYIKTYKVLQDDNNLITNIEEI